MHLPICGRRGNELQVIHLDRASPQFLGGPLQDVVMGPPDLSSGLGPGIPPQLGWEGNQHPSTLDTGGRVAAGAGGQATLPNVGRAVASPPGCGDPCSHRFLSVGWASPAFGIGRTEMISALDLCAAPSSRGYTHRDREGRFCPFTSGCWWNHQERWAG